MASNPYRSRWENGQLWEGLPPADWIKAACPRCKRITDSPRDLIGRVVCTACLPDSVLLVAYAEGNGRAQGKGRKGESNAR